MTNIMDVFQLCANFCDSLDWNRETNCDYLVCCDWLTFYLGSSEAFLNLLCDLGRCAQKNQSTAPPTQGNSFT